MNAEVAITVIDGRPVPSDGGRARMGWERVYFVLAPSAGLVKVGTTFRLPHRLAEIETMSPVPVELIGHVAGGVRREAEYHALFAEQRSHGEWFRYTDYVAHRIGLDCLLEAWSEASPTARRRFAELIRGH